MHFVLCLHLTHINNQVQERLVNTISFGLKRRCEQKRRGSDEPLGPLESRGFCTSQAAKAGNKEIRKRVSQAKTYRETNHTSSSQVSDALCPHALRRRTGRESLDHRGRRQLRLVDRHLRWVRTGKSRKILLTMILREKPQVMHVHYCSCAQSSASNKF